MQKTITAESVFRRSDDVVSREIVGELIIVPLTSDIGDMEDEIYTLNETGRVIWDRLDGTISIGTLTELLAAEYEGSAGEIERDVKGIVAELYRRRMIIESS